MKLFLNSYSSRNFFFFSAMRSIGVVSGRFHNSASAIAGGLVPRTQILSIFDTNKQISITKDFFTKNSTFYVFHNKAEEDCGEHERDE